MWKGGQSLFQYSESLLKSSRPKWEKQDFDDCIEDWQIKKGLRDVTKKEKSMKEKQYERLEAAVAKIVTTKKGRHLWKYWASQYVLDFCSFKHWVAATYFKTTFNVEGGSQGKIMLSLAVPVRSALQADWRKATNLYLRSKNV